MSSSQDKSVPEDRPGCGNLRHLDKYRSTSAKGPVSSGSAAPLCRSAAFTLSRYTHLPSGDEAPARDLVSPAAMDGESGVAGPWVDPDPVSGRTCPGRPEQSLI